MRNFKSVDSFTLLDCEQFLKENPSSELFDEVKERHAFLLKQARDEEDTAFSTCRTIRDFERYLSNYPKGRHTNAAKDKIESLFYHQNKDSKSGLQFYLSRYPHGRYSDSAKDELKSKQTKMLIGIALLIIALCITAYIGWNPVKYLSSDNQSVSVPMYSSTASVKISTNVDVEHLVLQDYPSWVSCALDGSSLKCKFSDNGGDSRKGEIVIRAYSTWYGLRISSQTVSVNVEQKSGLASMLSLSPSSDISISKGGTEKNILVKTDGCFLNVTSSDTSWISVCESERKSSDRYYHQDTYSISVSPNPGYTRYGSITASSGDKSYTIYLSQESGRATYLSLSRDEIHPTEGGTQPGRCYPVGIETDGVAWSAYTNYSWLTLTSLPNLNKLEIEVAENTGEVRTGYVTVKTNDGEMTATITISQGGKPSQLSLSKSEVILDTDADYEYVHVYRDGNYPIEVDNVSGGSWLSASISGDRLKISCTKNNNGARSGTVRVKCGNRTVRLSVKQKGWRSCWRCGGNGRIQCPAAGLWNGNYHYIQEFVMYNYYQGGYQQRPCPHCGGYGAVDCPECGGRGKFKTN